MTRGWAFHPAARRHPAAPPAQVYRNATEQFVEAERLGFDVGWVAQHHFDAEEGDDGLIPRLAAAIQDEVQRAERIEAEERDTFAGQNDPDAPG
jgi:hypothetical protein